MKTITFTHSNASNELLACSHRHHLAPDTLRLEPIWKEETLKSLIFKDKHQWVDWTDVLLRELSVIDKNRTVGHRLENSAGHVTGHAFTANIGT